MSTASQEISKLVREGDFKSLARAITIVENEIEGYEELLQAASPKPHTPVIGITGPPGAGKSSLINSLVKQFLQNQKRVAIIAVDPTSPFNYGSLLGDRLRMPELFNHPNVFIRSVATRGSLGGLSEKIIEITDVIRSSNFDYIIIETVGVGQSEVEIAGLADITIVVFVPESGDEIQTMKSGIMEIADIFVVNKSDREGADRFIQNLKHIVHSGSEKEEMVPVIKTSVVNNEGIEELALCIESFQKTEKLNKKKVFLLTEKAYRLIQKARMKGINKDDIGRELQENLKKGDFNLYRFVKKNYLI